MTRFPDAQYYKIATDWIVEAFDIVTSGDAFYDLLRDTPSYVPRTIAREVWREYGRQTAWEAFRLRRDPNDPLLRRFFTEGDYGFTSPYAVKTRYEGIDPETGETLTTHAMLYFDYVPSQAEIDDWAMAWRADYGPGGVPEEEITFDVAYLFREQSLPG